MEVLIVSPSALIRSTFKDLLTRVSVIKSVRELGSALQLESTISQYDPAMILLDEVLGIDPSTLIKPEGSTFSIVILKSGLSEKAGPGAILKPDFSIDSEADMILKYVPLLSALTDDAVKRRESNQMSLKNEHENSVTLVVIGASTGGPAAVRTVLSSLPSDFPCPIAVVQHIDTGYDSGYAEWLDNNTPLKVRLAKDNDRPVPGEVIVAPNDFHLVCNGISFGLDDGPKVLSQKPAVDRLFSTAARHHGSGLIAVLLTGIGSDGAKGCLEIVQSGGITIAQDEATSTVYGMPFAAAELNAATYILALDKIGPCVLELVEKRKRI